MNRSLVIRIGFALFLILAPIVHAEENLDTGERQATLMAAEIERMFGQLLGLQDVQPVYQEHGDGLASLSFTLPEGIEKDLVIGEEKARALLSVAAGISLIKPSRASSLIHTALSDRRFDYNYWWVVVNLTRNQDLDRTTTAKLLGPGKKFRRDFNLTYKANTVHLFFYDPKQSVDKAGVYTFHVKSPGAGAIVARTVAK